MVHLVLLLDAPEDGDGLLHAGLVHEDGLEAPFQGGVLLDLPVLVQGGGADKPKLPPGQGGLQHVAGVHGPLGLARPHHGVELVDEEDDFPLALHHLLDHRLQALLKLAPVLGPGQEGAHLQGDDALALEAFRHIPLDDALGQPLHDGGLTHPRFADEHRVVLGAPEEDLDGAPYLLVPADHWVQLALGGQLGEVDAVLLQGVVGAFRMFRLHGFTSS